MLEPDNREQGRRHLAATLRALRKAAGLSGQRLAVRAAMSQSKVGRASAPGPPRGAERRIKTVSYVTLSVLPFSAQIGASPLNVFVVYDERLVIVELFSGEIALRDCRDIKYHLNLFEHFADRTQKGNNTRTFLESAVSDFMRVRD